MTPSRPFFVTSRSLCWLVLALVLFGSRSTDGQVIETGFSARTGGTQTVTTGQSFKIEILLDHAMPVFLWSYGLVHDPSKLQLDSVQLIDHGPNTQDPDGFFFSGLEELSVIDNFSGNGVLHRTTLSFTQQFFFPPGRNRLLAIANYTNLMVETGDTTALQFEEGGLQSFPNGPIVIALASPGPGSGTAIPGESIGRNDLTLINNTPTFTRGRCSGTSSAIGIADALSMLRFLYAGVLPGCEDACDIDDTGDVTLTDPVTLLTVLFTGANPPLSFILECEFDATPDGLGCNTPTQDCAPMSL